MDGEVLLGLCEHATGANNELGVEINTSAKWVSVGNTRVRGHVFLGDKSLSAHMIARQIDCLDTPEQVIKLVERFNGFFSIIRCFPTSLIACVDRIRSMPLFYGVLGNRVCISDDAEWVRQRVEDKQIDSDAAQEFLMTGYVTGSDTLYQKVQQIQAGEAVIVKWSSEKPTLYKERYYSFWHSEPEQLESVEALAKQLDEAMVGSIKRLVQMASGRQLVIPLSGGFDSRLIAVLLRRLGYSNVLTFTYGVPGNREAVVSQTVARTLGFNWEFIEYNQKLWRKWSQSEERRNFDRFGSGWASLPHVQDWPAVWRLKETGKIEPGAIFVPGHTGDFICGGHIPGRFRGLSRLTTDDFVEEIFNRHYSLVRPRRRRRDRLLRLFYHRILHRAEVESITDPVIAANAYEKWEWQERQAKYIVNSVRVYEFWGYHWWCPFWDTDVMRFWESVPFAHRRPALYHAYVNNLWAKVSGAVVPQANHDALRSCTKAIIKPVRSLVYGSQLLLGMWRFAKAVNHPLSPFGYDPVSRLFPEMMRGNTLLGIAANDFLQSRLANA